MAKENDIPLGPPPARRPGSLRRTSSIQSHSFESMNGAFVMSGHGRDLFTGADPTEPKVLAQDSLSTNITSERKIRSISASRCNELVDQLVSLPLAGGLRKAMAELLPQELEQSTLLHRLLDDIVGASFVADASFDAWGMVSRDDEIRATESGYARTGMCITFAPGSSTLLPNGRARVGGIERIALEAPLYGGDSHAWHQRENPEGPNQMRMRRLDLWEEGEFLCVDAAFQDSAAFPDRRERLVFHEYRLRATIEPETFILQSVEVDPGVLPYSNCLQAPATAQTMVGQPLLNFRRSVPAQLPGVSGCTHLNDVLRSLQDVVAMSGILRLQSGAAL